MLRKKRPEDRETLDTMFAAGLDWMTIGHSPPIGDRYLKKEEYAAASEGKEPAYGYESEEGDDGDVQTLLRSIKVGESAVYSPSISGDEVILESIEKDDDEPEEEEDDEDEQDEDDDQEDENEQDGDEEEEEAEEDEQPSSPVQGEESDDDYYTPDEEDYEED